VTAHDDAAALDIAAIAGQLGIDESGAFSSTAFGRYLWDAHRYTVEHQKPVIYALIDTGALELTDRFALRRLPRIGSSALPAPTVISEGP
jgi:hypothetical protein